MMVLAQGEVAPPGRPLSEWLVDVVGLDPEGWFARILASTIEPLVQIVLITAAAWVIIRLIRRATRRVLERTSRRDSDGYRDPGVAGRRYQRIEALSAVFSSMVAVVIWSVAWLVILAATFGVSIAPFLAGAGIVGIALGFGAQDLVKDFVSGIFMLAEDQYAVGDLINVVGAEGRVEKVGLRSTRLRDVNGVVWHIPNGEIRKVGNLSQEWSRVLLDVGIGYSSDIELATSILKRTADEMAEEATYNRLFLSAPEVWGVQDLGADAVVIRLVIQTIPGEQGGIARELRKRIKLAFDSAGIEIPFQQRTLWVRQEGANGGASTATDGDLRSPPEGES